MKEHPEVIAIQNALQAHQLHAAISQMQQLPPEITDMNLRLLFLGEFYRVEELALVMAALPPHLKQLNLSSNRLNTPEKIEILKKITSPITILDVSNNLHGPDQVRLVEALIASLPPSVTFLTLCYHGFCEEEVFLKFKQLPPHLKTLDLSFNFKNERLRGSANIITTITRTITALRHLPKGLETLIFRDNDITEAEQIRAFQHLPATITELDIGVNPIKLDQKEVIEAFGFLPRTLLHLGLSETFHGAINAENLKRLMPLLPPHLLSLDLSWNGINKPDHITLLSETLPATLTYLSLARNGIDDHGALPLIRLLRKHRSIRSLSLEGNTLSAQSRQSIATILTQNQQLEHSRMKTAIDALLLRGLPADVLSQILVSAFPHQSPGACQALMQERKQEVKIIETKSAYKRGQMPPNTVASYDYTCKEVQDRFPIKVLTEAEREDLKSRKDMHSGYVQGKEKQNFVERAERNSSPGKIDSSRIS